MKINKKRTLFLLILLITLMFVCVIIAACGDGGSSENTDNIDSAGGGQQNDGNNGGGFRRIEKRRKRRDDFNQGCFNINNNFIGDRTGGGGASPLSMDMPNGWSVRISSIGFSDRDKNSFEFGVDPDIFVETTLSDAIEGKDAIIEFAMDFLSKR